MKFVPQQASRKYEDLELARAHHATLVAIFSQARTAHDAELAHPVLEACWGAYVCIDNVRCRARIRSIVEYADALFSPRKPGAPVVLHEQALNQAILRMLDSYAGWLDYIEAAREVGADQHRPGRLAASQAACAA